MPNALCAIATPDTAVASMTSIRYHKVPLRQQGSSLSTCPDKDASQRDASNSTLDKCPKNLFTPVEIERLLKAARASRHHFREYPPQVLTRPSD